MIELKPCPFCGGSVRFFDAGIPGEFEDWGIECSNCGIFFSGPGDEPGCVSTKREAADAWNRRAEDGNDQV